MAGRKPTKPPVEPVETHLEIDNAVPKLKEIQREAGNHVALVNKELGGGSVVPYNRNETLARIRGLMDAGAQLMLELGEQLIRLRENEPDSDFQSAMDQIGLDTRTAYRFIQAAHKFRLGLSTEQQEQFIKLPRGKLYELLVLDDEVVADLANGGSVAGLKMDDIDNMSTSELRKALRQAKADAKAAAETSERLITSKNERLDAQAEQLDQLTHGGKDTEKRLAIERETNAINAFKDASLELLGAIQKFDLAVADCLTERTEARQTLAEQTVTWLFQRIAQVATDRNMPVDFQAVVDPLALQA